MEVTQIHLPQANINFFFSIRLQIMWKSLFNKKGIVKVNKCCGGGTQQRLTAVGFVFMILNEEIKVTDMKLKIQILN